jgi:hypothetical protein
MGDMAFGTAVVWWQWWLGQLEAQCGQLRTGAGTTGSISVGEGMFPTDAILSLAQSGLWLHPALPGCVTYVAFPF